MKTITEESEKSLIKALQMMSHIEVKGRENLVHMVNAIDAIQEVLRQVNTPEDVEKEAEE